MTPRVVFLVWPLLVSAVFALADCASTDPSRYWRASTKDDLGPEPTTERIEPACTLSSPDTDGSPVGGLGPQLIELDGEPAFAGVGMCRMATANLARTTAAGRAYQTFSDGVANYMRPLWSGFVEQGAACKPGIDACASGTYFSELGMSPKLITEYWENDEKHIRVVRKAMKLRDLKEIIATTKYLSDEKRAWLLKQIDAIPPTEEAVRTSAAAAGRKR